MAHQRYEGCLEDTSLQSLKLYGPQGKLPEWIAQLTHLKKMHLEMTPLSEEHLKPLRFLKELSILRLSFKEALGGTLVFFVTLEGEECRSYEGVKVLQISCCSRVDVTLIRAMCNLELLHLKGFHDETVQRELWKKLVNYPKRPILEIL